MEDNLKDYYSPGIGILISVGKWGGIYATLTPLPRLVLGFIAITLMPYDGDGILMLASDCIKAVYKKDTTE